MNGQVMEAAGSSAGGDDRWLVDLQQQLESASRQPTLELSLYHLPLKLRIQNLAETPFSPNVVSIGPWHYGDPRYADMEKQKLRYMASLLQRRTSDNSQNTLIECATKVSELASLAQDSYNGFMSSHPHGSGDIVKLLLVDGCFILELLIRYYYKVEKGKEALREVLNRPIFSSNANTEDPLLNVTWTASIIRLDVALLTNQIPFFILEGLLCVIAGNDFEQLGHDLLGKMARVFFKPLLQNSEFLSPKPHEICEPRTHLLSFLWDSFRKPASAAVAIGIDDDIIPQKISIPNASKLIDSGISFEPVPNKNLLEVDFCNGVLKIPPLHLTECTESLLCNLMAFECYKKNPSQIIASYVLLMSQLVQIPEDVNLLEAQGIIINGLGNGEGVCSMFSRLVPGNFPNTCCFDDLFSKLNKDLERRRSFQEKLKCGYVPTRLGNIRFMAFYYILIFVALVVFVCSTLPYLLIIEILKY